MNLVVFDIDDTLTQTMEVDVECLLQAVRELLTFDPSDLDWNDFPHVTSDGVLEVLYQRAFGRSPGPGDRQAFLERSLELLDIAHRNDPTRFTAVPGAPEILAHLVASPRWTVALATGAWRRTAEFKLDAAGLEHADLPFASSDDHVTRAVIVQTAIDRAGRANGLPGGFDRVVAVGDGGWDVTTARALGLAFVGVGPPDRLETIGARVGVRDYTDAGRFMHLLETAPAL